MNPTQAFLNKNLESMLAESKLASDKLSQLSGKKKNQVLISAAKLLLTRRKEILAANQKDLKSAASLRLSSAMVDRLTLNPKRIAQMAQGIRQVASLTDPIGKIQSKWKRPNGLVISKVTVPLGVILIIFESRPNVTVECASLCIKSGNAAILRGGREAFYTNAALVEVFEKALAGNGLPKGAVSFVSTTDYGAVDFLLSRDQDINLVIPRGGEGLIRKVAEKSRIPVVKHYQGICHVYVDQKANLSKALKIVLNAKLQRPGVCNAMETLLVHEKIAGKFLPMAAKELQAGGCEVRADQSAKTWMPFAKLAEKEDFGREFLDKILAVKTVKNVEDAIKHIQSHGSAHTDAIVTEDKRVAKIFTDRVDSSSVMVNASTRFADGFEFGFGAEIGISTDKIHARGPMGLEGLTSYKYIVQGSGQTRV